MHLHSLLQGYRINAQMVSQFELIFIANSAMNKVRAKDWQQSFKRVNLRPSRRVPFKEYITKVQSVVAAGDFYFHERHGMFDSMPACWKSLTEVQRRELAALLRSFYEEARRDSIRAAWSYENFQKVMMLGFVKCEDVHKFRSAFMASIGDESVFVDPP